MSEQSFRNILFQDRYDFRFEVPVEDLRFSERNELVSCITKHFVIHRVKAELDQICSGLSDTLNNLSVIKQYPNLFKPFFYY